MRDLAELVLPPALTKAHQSVVHLDVGSRGDFDRDEPVVARTRIGENCATVVRGLQAGIVGSVARCDSHAFRQQGHLRLNGDPVGPTLVAELKRTREDGPRRQEDSVAWSSLVYRGL